MPQKGGKWPEMGLFDHLEELRRRLLAALALFLLASAAAFAFMDGILPLLASALAKGRRYAIVAIAIGAGVITPRSTSCRNASSASR
jgi:Sec-independent protein secretion pathway component TatC